MAPGVYAEFADHSHSLEGEHLVVQREAGPVVPWPVLNGYFDHLGLPRTTDAQGRILLVLPAGPWEVFRRSGIWDPSLRYPRSEGFLGSVVLAPERATDLAAGADPH